MNTNTPQPTAGSWHLLPICVEEETATLARRLPSLVRADPDPSLYAETEVYRCLARFFCGLTGLPANHRETAAACMWGARLVYDACDEPNDHFCFNTIFCHLLPRAAHWAIKSGRLTAGSDSEARGIADLILNPEGNTCSLPDNNAPLLRVLSQVDIGDDRYGCWKTSMAARRRSPEWIDALLLPQASLEREEMLVAEPRSREAIAAMQVMHDRGPFVREDLPDWLLRRMKQARKWGHCPDHTLRHERQPRRHKYASAVTWRVFNYTLFENWGRQTVNGRDALVTEPFFVGSKPEVDADDLVYWPPTQANREAARFLKVFGPGIECRGSGQVDRYNNQPSEYGHRTTRYEFTETDPTGTMPIELFYRSARLGCLRLFRMTRLDAQNVATLHEVARRSDNREDIDEALDAYMDAGGDPENALEHIRKPWQPITGEPEIQQWHMPEIWKPGQRGTYAADGLVDWALSSGKPRKHIYGQDTPTN